MLGLFASVVTITRLVIDGVPGHRSDVDLPAGRRATAAARLTPALPARAAAVIMGHLSGPA